MSQRPLNLNLTHDLFHDLASSRQGLAMQASFFNNLKSTDKSCQFMPKLNDRYIARYTSPNLPFPNILIVLYSATLLQFISLHPLGVWHCVDLL